MHVLRPHEWHEVESKSFNNVKESEGAESNSWHKRSRSQNRNAIHVDNIISTQFSQTCAHIIAFKTVISFCIILQLNRRKDQFAKGCFWQVIETVQGHWLLLLFLLLRHNNTSDVQQFFPKNKQCTECYENSRYAFNYFKCTVHLLQVV